MFHLGILHSRLHNLHLALPLEALWNKFPGQSTTPACLLHFASTQLGGRIWYKSRVSTVDVVGMRLSLMGNEKRTAYSSSIALPCRGDEKKAVDVRKGAVSWFSTSRCSAS